MGAVLTASVMSNSVIYVRLQVCLHSWNRLKVCLSGRRSKYPSKCKEDSVGLTRCEGEETLLCVA